MSVESLPTSSTDRPAHREAHAHAAEDQPFDYPLEREYVEPDWTRLPGYPRRHQGAVGVARSGSAPTPSRTS